MVHKSEQRSQAEDEGTQRKSAKRSATPSKLSPRPNSISQ